MKEDTTRSLSRALQNIKDDKEADSFIQNHSDNTTLSGFLNWLMAEKNVSIPVLIAKSGISRNYIYNILSGDRTNPGRDKVIAICIGAGASFSEINKALEIAGHSPLYPRNERDVRIAITINKGITNVTKVNLILESKGLNPLDV